MRDYLLNACLTTTPLAQQFDEYISHFPGQGQSRSVLCRRHCLLFCPCGHRGHHHGDRQPKQLIRRFGLLAVIQGLMFGVPKLYPVIAMSI